MAMGWDAMFAELAAFQKKHKHCLVPTVYQANPKLGRWVATQRYKGRVGELTHERRKQLDDLGFIWSPSERAWQQHYERLLEFQEKHGHCDVPEHYPEDQPLASWVQRQRIAKKRNKLLPDRISRLDAVDFRWAIYKLDTGQAKQRRKRKRRPGPTHEIRLYRLADGKYVMHDSRQAPPESVIAYAKANRGALPAYIPMPGRPTVFRMSGSPATAKRYKWDGEGALPPAVLRYVQRHGVLPQRG